MSLNLCHQGLPSHLHKEYPSLYDLPNYFLCGNTMYSAQSEHAPGFLFFDRTPIAY